MKISIFAFLAFASADDSKKGPLVTDKVNAINNRQSKMTFFIDFLFYSGWRNLANVVKNNVKVIENRTLRQNF